MNFCQNFCRNFNLRCVVVLVCVTGVAGCGFTMRGSQQSGSQMVGQLFLEEQGSVSVLQPLRNALKAQQVQFAALRDNADTLVILSDEVLSRRVASVSGSGKVSEYELLHSVGLRTIRSEAGVKAGELVVDTGSLPKIQTVSVARDYTYDETDVLAKDDEEQILRAEMKEELVRHLLLVVFSGLR